MTTLARPSANRWFVLACAALAVNAYGVWRLAHPLPAATPATGQAGSPPTFLLDHLANTPLAGRQSVCWNFDRPMVDTAATGSWRSNRVMRVEPSTPGDVRWESPMRLAFRPAADWRPCNRYQFIATPALADPADMRPVNPILAELASAPFTLTAFRQVSYNPLQGRATLRAVFNDRPADGQLPGLLKLTPRNQGWNLTIRDARVTAANEVEFECDPHAQRHLELSIAAGSRGVSGPLPAITAAPLPLTLESRMFVDAITGAISGLDQPLISGRVSNPLDLTRAAAFITLDPPLPFTVESVNSWYGENRFQLRGAFVPGQVYKVRFHSGLPGVNGEVLEREVAHTVAIPDYAPTLRFADAGRYLSTRGRRTLTLEGVNVNEAVATVRRIHDNNLLYFAMRESDRYTRDYGSHVRGLMGPASSLTLTPHLERNQPGTFPLDLSAIVTNSLRGAYWVCISRDPTTPEPSADYEYGDDEARSLAARLVVVSDLGLSVKHAPGGVLAWVTSLHTGAAVSGATVRVYSVSNQELGSGVSGTDGVVEVPLDPAADDSAEPYVITAATPDDLTVLALDATRVSIAGEQGGAPYHRAGYEAYLYADRGVYRPGETVHLRAVVRDAQRHAPEPFPLALHVIRPDGRDATSLTAMTGPLGTAAFTHTFAPDAPVGRYTLAAMVPGAPNPIGTLELHHEEFVPPQIVVKLETDSSRTATGTAFEVVTSASHLYGAPAASLAMRRAMTIKAAPFAPAGWDGHVFGDPERPFSTVYMNAREDALNSEGVNRAAYTVDPPGLPPAALQVVLESTVLDATGRPVTCYGRRDVDPVPFYLGLKLAPGAWIAGHARTVEIAAVHPSGAATNAAAVSARLIKVMWNTVLERWDHGGYGYVSKPSRTTVWTREVPLAAGRAAFAFAPETAGDYELCVVADSGAASRIPLTIADGTPGWEDASVRRAGRVEVAVDAPAAVPGQTVTLTAKAPFKGLALVTLESDRLITNTVVAMAGNVLALPLRIPDDADATVYAVVSVIRPLQAGDVPGTHRATGLAAVRVTRPAEHVALALEAPSLIRPQSALAVTVRAPSLAGQAAEVTIAAVDEGICMLTDFQTPDIGAWLNRPRRLSVALFDAFNFLLPEVSEALYSQSAKTGGDGDMGLSRRLNPVDAKRFRPVALWSGTLPLAPDGSAVATFAVPEFTGKLRLMAVACAGTAYGRAEQHVLVRRDLVVQPALPRFAAPGDRFAAAMRLQNLSGAPLTAAWSLAVSGPATLAGPTNGTAILARDGQQLVGATLVAAASAGVARVTFAAGEGQQRYTETIELAVRPARASVVESGAFAVAPGETRAHAWPADFAPGSVQDRLSVAGLPTLAFAGGLESLFRYPYGCLEQTTSTAFPLLYLVDLAELTDPRGRSRDANAARVQAGIERVLSMQLPDGWLALWPSARDAYAHGSLYAAHFLTEAAQAGYDVPEGPFQDLLKAIQSGLSAWSDGAATSLDLGDTDMAYALYVLALNDRWMEGWSARLEEQGAALPVSARVLNASARAVTGRRDEAARLLQAAGPAALAGATPRRLGGSLDSPVRDLALLLAAWLEVDPAHSAVPDIARRLEASQAGGRGWYTTHDNALALMALGKYAARVAATAQPFAAGITLGAVPLVASTEQPLTLKPLAALDPVTIVNRGPGVAYVSWTRAGVPPAGVEPDSGDGLGVRREWFDGTGQPISPAALRQGTLVVVKITVDSLGGDVDQVAVEELLPAGLEVENAALKTAATLPWVAQHTAGPVAHVEQRDDRVLAFSGAFNGTLSFCYLARAVTPGDFVLPAVTAACMYDPALRAASGAGHLRVEARP